jgi:cellulose synthase/poly-beta-1,6-N-acetylglucosamine synthase-like glycosyltransferase
LNTCFASDPSPMFLAELIFWLLAAVLLWAFFGYPVAMIARAAIRPTRPEPPAGRATEPLSVVLAVRNEAANIADRVANLLSLDYPPELLEVIVVCNGCTDETVAVASRLAEEDLRVRVVESAANQGKSGAINLGVAQAKGTYVVFADARQRFDGGALHHLLAPFQDASVGAVTGRLIISNSDRPAVEGVRWYWQVETALRSAESRTGSVVGASGAIYAIRRELFEPMPPNLILDDVYVPVSIAVRGFRTAMAEGALAIDRPSPRQAMEFSRKRRTMLGNVQLVRVMPELLLPWKNPLFVRFVSHKLLRLCLPFCLVGMVALAWLLGGWMYNGFLIAAAAGYGAGILGLVIPLRLLSVPSTFVMMHGAILSAVLRSSQSAAEVWSQTAEPDRVEASSATVG